LASRLIIPFVDVSKGQSIDSLYSQDTMTLYLQFNHPLHTKSSDAKTYSESFAKT